MFKRFLKEIGLYSNWIKNRKIYLDAIKGVKFENRYIMENLSSVWAPARIQPNLGYIIDWSFDYWNHTDGALWHELYMRLKDVSADRMLDNDVLDAAEGIVKYKLGLIDV